jgi:hypothetical protein
MTRRPAQGQWKGFACLPYGMLAAFLKVPPAGSTVRLRFEDGRLSIGASRYRAQWIEVSPWIGAMAMEVHFLGAADKPTPKLFCPRCGKRQGHGLDDLRAADKRTVAEDKLLGAFEGSEASHGCAACLHGWIELDTR